MVPYTSKEMYIMNGGNKVYMYMDGFMDVYQATPEEEATWDQEIVANALAKVATETNEAVLKAAIDNLIYHKYQALKEVLLKHAADPDPARRQVFKKALASLKG